MKTTTQPKQLKSGGQKSIFKDSRQARPSQTPVSVLV